MFCQWIFFLKSNYKHWMEENLHERILFTNTLKQRRGQSHLLPEHNTLIINKKYYWNYSGDTDALIYMFTGKSRGNTLQHDKFISWLTGVGVLIEMGKYQFSKVTVCPNVSHVWETGGKSQPLAVSITCPHSLIYTYSHQFLIRAIERCLMCKQSSGKI